MRICLITLYYDIRITIRIFKPADQLNSRILSLFGNVCFGFTLGTKMDVQIITFGTNEHFVWPVRFNLNIWKNCFCILIVPFSKHRLPHINLRLFVSYWMVTQNTLRTRGGKQVLFSLLCAQPFNISTMG